MNPTGIRKKKKNITLKFFKYLGFLDNGQYIVLCGTKKQLQELSKLTYIEIDMAFKRIHGTTNEWEVSAYSFQAQKSKLNIHL